MGCPLPRNLSLTLTLIRNLQLRINRHRHLAHERSTSFSSTVVCLLSLCWKVDVYYSANCPPVSRLRRVSNGSVPDRSSYTASLSASAPIRRSLSGDKKERKSWIVPYRIVCHECCCSAMWEEPLSNQLVGLSYPLRNMQKTHQPTYMAKLAPFNLWVFLP